MLFSIFLISCKCFSPVCEKSFTGNLWTTLNGFSCNGDALITIDSQTIPRYNWANIGSWMGFNVAGTLKIQGRGKVAVDGGFKITGWTKDTQNPNILKTTVSKTIQGMGDKDEDVTNWLFESLWVNDKSATRARVPSDWTLPTITSIYTSGSGEFITYTVGVPSNTMKFLRTLNQEELTSTNIVIFHYWSTTRAYIKSIDTNANTISFIAHSVNTDNNQGIEAGKSYFYLDNLKTALTKPGEWFLSKSGELFYYPRPGETASNIEVYASHYIRLMYVQTNNLIIENIEFRHCGGNIPETGVTREDLVPTKKMKAIDVYKSNNVQFINCSFRHVFCRALSIFESNNCVVEQCLIEDFGADGIAIGDSTNTRIYNNILRHGGRIIHHENAIYDNYDPGLVISHNEISDIIWDGINCWVKDRECQMTIEKNHVHHIGYNLLDDIGCIYVTNAKKGVVLQNNYVHKAGCHNYGAWGLYVDLNCYDVVVQNNVAHDFFDGCIHFHYGFNNVVKNNIIGFNKKGLLSKGQNNQGTMVTVYNNIFITDEGHFYCDLWAGNSFNSYSNLYWDFGKGIRWFGDNDGRDNTGTYADPKFKDPMKRDFTFADDSVARGIGFVPFDYSDCGVVGTEWRKFAESYVNPEFPEKSTNDEELFSSEKVYPDHDYVETPSASRSRSPTSSQSPSASRSLSPTQSLKPQTQTQTPSSNVPTIPSIPTSSLTKPPTQTPSESPSKSPTASPSRSPSPTPNPGLSGLEVIGETSTYYLNEDYLVENSRFINCTLKDGGEYLFVVRSESHFKDVDFSFLDGKIGAIKIEYFGEVTIENCVFTGCSTSSGNGNAILISQTQAIKDAKDLINIKDCTFNNCGSKGYSVSVSASRNNPEGSLVQFSSCTFKNCKGGLMLNDQKRSARINSCTFSSLSNDQNGSALFVSSISSVLVDSSGFSDNSCSNYGGAIYVSKEATTLFTVSSCSFTRNHAKTAGNAIFIDDQLEGAKFSIKSNSFVDNYYTTSNVGYVIVCTKLDLDVSTNDFVNTDTQLKVNSFMNLLNPPFKTPVPMPTVEIVVEDVLDTSSLTDGNTQYIAKVTTDKVTLTGEGNPNLYLKLEKEAEIEETKATFGIMLDPAAESTSVKLKQQEANMNIVGGGTLNIDTDESVKALEIGDVTVSHQEDLHLSIKQNLASFGFHNLKLYGQSTFGSNFESSNTQTKVGEIMIFEGAETKMSNLNVEKNIDIEKGSTIELDKVELSTVDMKIAIEEGNKTYATLTGNIGNPPNSLVFKGMSNAASLLDGDQVFYIAFATQENFANCEAWKEHVNLEGTKFTKVECEVKDGKQVLYATTKIDEVQPTKKKSKISLPIFIGIICAVVVVIVVVVVVIVVVVKKKKRVRTSDLPKETLNNDDDNDNEDDQFAI